MASGDLQLDLERLKAQLEKEANDEYEKKVEELMDRYNLTRSGAVGRLMKSGDLDPYKYAIEQIEMAISAAEYDDEEGVCEQLRIAQYYINQIGKTILENEVNQLIGKYCEG